MISKPEKENPSWKECQPLEQWIERALRESTGHDSEIIALMRMMPEEKKVKYRTIWKKYRGKK